MFTTYSSGSSQDSLHAEIGRCPKFAPRRTRLATLLVASMLFGAVSLATSGAALAGPCTGPGAPTTTQTQCLTAVQIPGNPLRSYDISWVNPDRAEYYLADRSNAGIDIINTLNLTFKRTLGGLSSGSCSTPHGAVDNIIPGPTASFRTAGGSMPVTATARSRCSISMRLTRLPQRVNLHRRRSASRRNGVDDGRGVAAHREQRR